MPIVFTDSWISESRKRYEKHKNIYRPLVYFAATSNDSIFKSVRDHIEIVVALLPLKQQRVLVQRLRSKDNFQTTYNEVIVGYLLSRMGFQIEYEKEIDGRTPDWYLNDNDGNVFVVEVISCNSSVHAHNHLGRLYATAQEDPEETL